MTVNDAGAKITYVTNGSTNQWFFPFAGGAPEDILVFVTDALGGQTQIPQGQYTVAMNFPIPPNPTSISGFVFFPVSGPALAAGGQITIVRDMPAKQDTSVSNQSIIYPPIIEQEFDKLTMVDQQLEERVQRNIRVAISDPDPAPLPPIAIRRLKGAFFDGDGNLTAGVADVSTVHISAVMEPVVGAATLKDAQIQMGFGPNGYAALNGQKYNLFSTTTIINAQKGYTVDLTGDVYYGVVFNAPSTYDNDFQVLLYNSSNRAKSVQIPGFVTFNIYPRQQCLVSNNFVKDKFLVTQVGRWRPGIATNIYVDPSAGSDAGDGLATGVGAFATIQRAIQMIEREVDGQFTINLADGDHNVGAGLICAQGVIGAKDYSIVGNVGNSANCRIFCNPAGNIALTVQDNAAATIRGVRFTSTGGTYFVRAIRGGVLTIGQVEFDNVGVSPPALHIWCDVSGTINIDQPYKINGGAYTHLYCANGGTINYVPGTITFTAASAFTFFINCDISSAIYSQKAPQTFNSAGLATGQQYAIFNNSVVHLAGSTVPGTVAGVTSSGGIIA